MGRERVASVASDDNGRGRQDHLEGGIKEDRCVLKEGLGWFFIRKLHTTSQVMAQKRGQEQ